ncbi:MAG TPA: hypothetical protein DIS77_09795 [Rothia sp.]|nr:hypothetical protein [Rothia sp. (in: high G+C Gram-positive bacteria)]
METLNSKQVIAREIKSMLARLGLTQRDLAKLLAITPAGVSDKLHGRSSFTFDELLIIAGSFGLSLQELLGDELVSSRVPSPSYVEEKGKKKAVPAGFIPTGTTYQMVTSTEPELVSVGPAGLEPATKGL